MQKRGRRLTNDTRFNTGPGSPLSLGSEGGGFGQTDILTPGQDIAPAFAPEVSIRVAELLP